MHLVLLVSRYQVAFWMVLRIGERAHLLNRQIKRVIHHIQIEQEQTVLQDRLSDFFHHLAGQVDQSSVVDSVLLADVQKVLILQYLQRPMIIRPLRPKRLHL